jgi:hypothetical protein
VCLQPWPNDYFTVADAGTPTGRRLDLQREAMPKNVAGKPIEPGDQRRPDRGADAEAARRRADGALRSRAARRRLGGRPGAPARHGQALQLRLLRDRLDRDVVQRRRQRPHDPQRPLALPDAHRSPPAGAAELPLPRPAHCARGSPTSPASRDGSTPPGSSTTANSQGGITGFPSSGSVYEPWDAGAGYNALAPNANTPPVESAQNQDPHGVPRRIAGAQEQKSEHLKLAGAITDQCGGGPCDGVP